MASSPEGKRTSKRVAPDRNGSIPARLSYLVSTHYPESRGRPFTAKEISTALGGSPSSVYIYKILNGERTRPDEAVLRKLASFFNVPVRFFTDEQVEEELPVTPEQRNDLLMLREPGVREALELLKQPGIREIVGLAARLPEAARPAVADILRGVLRAQSSADSHSQVSEGASP